MVHPKGPTPEHQTEIKSTAQMGGFCLFWLGSVGETRVENS